MSSGKQQLNEIISLEELKGFERNHKRITQYDKTLTYRRCNKYQNL